MWHVSPTPRGVCLPPISDPAPFFPNPPSHFHPLLPVLTLASSWVVGLLDTPHLLNGPIFHFQVTQDRSAFVFTRDPLAAPSLPSPNLLAGRHRCPSIPLALAHMDGQGPVGHRVPSPTPSGARASGILCVTSAHLRRVCSVLLSRVCPTGGFKALRIRPSCKAKVAYPHHPVPVPF